MRYEQNESERTYIPTNGPSPEPKKCRMKLSVTRKWKFSTSRDRKTREGLFVLVRIESLCLPFLAFLSSRTASQSPPRQAASTLPCESNISTHVPHHVGVGCLTLPSCCPYTTSQPSLPNILQPLQHANRCEVPQTSSSWTLHARILPRTTRYRRSYKAVP